MRPPIHSRKHYVQLSQSNVAQGVILNTGICQAQEGAHASATTISEGALVKAVWCEVWISNDSASVLGSFTGGLYKNPGNSNTMVAADAAALHDYDNKKNIFYATQGLAPATDQQLMLAFKGWIKIPKGKQRMGLADKLVWFTRNNNATAVDIQVCGLFIFKEYE